jgi:DNA-directed RNA polymerase I, II, and III subunit RPABC2
MSSRKSNKLINDSKRESKMSRQKGEESRGEKEEEESEGQEIEEEEESIGEKNDENDEDEKLDDHDYGDGEGQDEGQEESDGEIADETQYEEGEEPGKAARCVYKFNNKKIFDDDDDDEIEEDIIYDDDKNDEDIIVKSEDRIAKPYLTKYEKVRILGDRTKMLASGAKPMLKNTEHLTSREIAKKELEEKVFPLIVEKVMPNKKREHWYIHELVDLNN